MNILVGNTQEFNPLIGGVERVSSTIALKLSERGHNVYFVACLKSDYSKDYIPVVEQIILPNNIYDTSDNFVSLMQFCIDKKIDIILNQAGNILDFTRLLAQVSKKLDIPLISAIHTNPMNRISAIKDYRYSKIYKNSFVKIAARKLIMPFRYVRIFNEESQLYKEVYASSDKIVLLSEKYKKELYDFIGNDYQKKIIAIQNPNDAVHKVNHKDKGKYILFVGRLDFEHKRPDRMIQIWEKIFKDYPDWKLKIAGDGPNKQDLIDYVNNKKIRNVEFLGFCNTEEHYRTASLLCMTSTIEGLPMALIEGISYGCIPLAFDSFKSIYDVIEDNKNGYIIKAYNLKKYENKLRLLMDNSKLRERMSEESFRMSHKFNLNITIDKWINILCELRGEEYCE